MSTPPEAEVTTPPSPEAAEAKPNSKLEQLGERTLLWMVSEKHALRSFAAVRILLGLIVLMSLLFNAADRHYLWGVASAWVDPAIDAAALPQHFSMLFPKDNSLAFDLTYVLLVVCTVALVAGWQTRIVTPIVLVLWGSLSANSSVLVNSGDTVLRLALLFMVFADTASHWSVDSFLRRRRSRIRRLPWPAWVGAIVHNTALLLCCVQLLIVYVTSSINKLEDPTWLDGTAVYYALNLERFTSFAWLNELVSSSSVVVHMITWVSLLAQLLLPLCLLWRPSRIVILIVVTGMHLGVALLLGIWAFSTVMIALDLLFIRDRTWVTVGACIRAQSAKYWPRMLRRRDALPGTVSASTPSPNVHSSGVGGPDYD